MTEKQLFAIYFVAWAIVGIISWILEKRAKEIKLKRKIRIVTGIIIIGLMVAVAYLMGGMHIIGLGVIAVIGIGFVLFGDQYTYDCPKCGKSTTRLFEKVMFCSKCGTNLKDLK